MFSQEQIEYLHEAGMMPDRYYYQQNGKSAYENYRIQKQRIREGIMDLYTEQRIQEALKEIQRLYEEAAIFSIEQSIDEAANVFADHMISCIDGTFSGGSINPGSMKNKSFAVMLGAALGRAIGQAPEKLLEDLYKDRGKR